MSDRPRGPGRPLGQVIRKMERKSRRHDIRFADDVFEFQQGPEGTMVDIDGDLFYLDGLVGIVTVLISARTGGPGFPFTVGKGLVALGNLTGETMVATGNQIWVYNMTLSTIAVDSVVGIEWFYRKPFAVIADCTP